MLYRITTLSPSHETCNKAMQLIKSLLFCEDSRLLALWSLIDVIQIEQNDFQKHLDFSFCQDLVRIWEEDTSDDVRRSVILIVGFLFGIGFDFEYFRIEFFLEILNSNSNLLKIAAVFALKKMCFVRGFDEVVLLRFIEILLCEESQSQSFVVVKEVFENLIDLLDFVPLDKVLWVIKNNCFAILEKFLVFEDSIDEGIMTKIRDLLGKYLNIAEVNGWTNEFVESFEQWHGFDVLESMYELFKYFIDIHILTDNVKMIDYIRGRKR
jgi:hypothetical protein